MTQSTSGSGSARHRDEMEQLRTALESALEENAHLAEDRDRLLRRVSWLSREMQQQQRLLAEEKAPAPEEPDPRQARQDQTDEELRVAFEELQVLTEELEVANSSLQETNEQLDARVEERTTQLNTMNIALAAAEDSLRTIADLVPDLLWRTDADGGANWFNQRWFNYTGHERAESIGDGWTDALHPLDRDEACAAWRTSRESGQPFEAEYRLRDGAGAHRWFLIRAEPMRDEQGAILAWFAAGTDIHERRMALQALERSERRFRSLIEGMPQLVWRAVDGGQWTWCSPQWSAFTGQPQEESHAHGWLAMIHSDDRDDALEGWAKASETGGLDMEGRIFRAEDGRYRFFRTRALPVHDETGKIVEWLGTSTDVDDLRRLRDQQSVLVAELQHRTRNLMAVVQAVTFKTLKGASSLEQFQEAIEDRLQALARAQGLLSRRNDGLRVTFDALLHAELAAHIAPDVQDDGRITISGPEGIPLWSSIVQTLALALHELTTNAVKYGALSQEDGRLTIRWELSQTESAQRSLHIEWRESGVAIAPADRDENRIGGYGRELIERALPYQLGARTSYDLTPDGVHCVIEIEVPQEERSIEPAPA